MLPNRAIPWRPRDLDWKYHMRAVLVRAVLVLVLMSVIACQRHPSPIAITLPDCGRLSAFQLTAQTGQPFSSHSLEGKVWVLDFIFTTCQAACPRMSGEMYKVQEAVKDIRGVQLVSITVDPQQ